MKKYKKGLWAAFAVAALASAFAFGGCTGTEAEHKHEWNDWRVTTPATCTTAGEKVRTCKTDSTHKETEVIPATGHEFATGDNWTVDVAPTCQTKGSKSHHCTHDGCSEKADVTEMPVDPDAHKWATDWTVDKDPTCTEKGSQSHHCTVAGCTAKRDDTPVDIDPEAHEWADTWTVDVEPTCQTKGSKSHHCTHAGCNAKTDVTEVAVDPDAHEWATDWTIDVASTCQAKGSKSHHCLHTGCNEKHDVTEVDVDPDAHDFAAGDDWTVDIPATCTADGSKSHHCKHAGCTAKKDDTVIAAGDGTHVYSEEFTVDKEPTCTDKGSKSHHCTKCDAKKDVTEIGELGHDYATGDNWTVDKAATCTEAGSKSHHCSRCDSATDVTAIDVIPHTWSDDYIVDTPATCTEAGSKSHHCDVCGAHDSDVELPALGHSYGNWVVTLQPTADATGTATKICANDDKHVIEHELPVLGDVSYKKGDDTATCSTTGTQTYTLTVDDEDISFDVVTPAKTGTLVQVAASTNSETAYDITLPNGKKLTANRNLAYYECSSCHKKFAANEHSDDYVITLSTFVVGSPTVLLRGNFYGNAVVGTNKIPYKNSHGIIFKAEKSGNYKFSSVEDSVLSAGTYFDKTITDTRGSLIYNNAWQSSAAQFYRFTSSPATTPACVYVKMDAGDVVVLFFKPTATTLPTVLNIVIEEVADADMPECRMHVAGGYDFSTINPTGGSIAPQCKVCGATVPGDPIVYNKGVTVAAANEDSPVACLGGDDMLVKTSADETFYSFTPTAVGDYTFGFSALTDNTLGWGAKVTCDGAIAAMYLGGSWNYNSPYNNGAIAVSTNTDGLELVIKVDDTLLNKVFKFSVTAENASAAPAVIKAVVLSESPKVIIYGDNTVTITEANSNLWKDAYSFVSETDKEYSLTVPEGVEVLKDNADFITSGATFANFTATAGTKIVFAFKNTVKGDITVTVGEFKEIPMPMLELGVALEINMVSHEVVSVGFASGLEDGKQYKITFSGQFTMARIQDTGYFYLNINGVNVFDELSSDNSITMQNPTNGTKDGIAYSVTPRGAWTATFTYHEGDVVNIAPLAGRITAGDVIAPMVLTLTAA